LLFPVLECPPEREAISFGERSLSYPVLRASAVSVAQRIETLQRVQILKDLDKEPIDLEDKQLVHAERDARSAATLDRREHRTARTPRHLQSDAARLSAGRRCVAANAFTARIRRSFGRRHGIGKDGAAPRTRRGRKSGRAARRTGLDRRSDQRRSQLALGNCAVRTEPARSFVDGCRSFGASGRHRPQRYRAHDVCPSPS